MSDENGSEITREQGGGGLGNGTGGNSGGGDIGGETGRGNAELENKISQAQS